jgi:hypothetical protein
MAQMVTADRKVAAVQKGAALAVIVAPKAVAVQVVRMANVEVPKAADPRGAADQSIGWAVRRTE